MYKKILALLVVLLVFKDACCLAPQNWIYSPQYSYTIKATDSQSFYAKMKVSTSTGLVFLAAGDAGVVVIDPTSQQIIATAKSTDHILGFTITDNTNYLFMSCNSKLTVFQFINRSSFVQVGQDSAQIYIIDIRINTAMDTIYIFQIDGDVRILNVANPSSPTLVGSITWKAQQIYGGIVTPDEKFLLLCQDNQGLGIFALTKTAGSVTGVLAGTYTATSSHNVILTPDLHYIINLDQRHGLSIGDFTQVTGAAPASYPVSFTYSLTDWWPSNVVVPSPYSFCISPDGNYLFLGVRSIGIYTIDITNKNSPQTYQWSYFPFHGISIALSPDYNSLYFSNSISFMSFRKMVPNLGLKYVNLYNSLHSLGFDGSNTKYYWRCDYDPVRQVYLGAFDTDGLWFLDVSNPTQFNVLTSSYKPPGSTANMDVFTALNNYQVLITSMNDGTNFMAVLDISNYASVAVIQKVPLGIPVTTYIKDMDTNNANTFMVCSMDRTIVFIDISTLGSYVVKAIWNFLPSMKGFTTGVMLSWDEKYFIGACRNYGYFVLDITNLNNIQMVMFQDSTGAEQIYKSTTYSYQYYLIDGLGGLFIMDQTKLPNFVQFSQLVVSGWTNDVTFLNQENTVVISTMQQGMIYLLDISNNKNPFIVSAYEFGDQNGTFTCAKQDFSLLFINNNIQVRTYPMTVSVYIHTDYLEVLGYSNTGDMNFNIIDNPDTYSFEVGQTVKLNVCFLYQPLDLVVSSVDLYQKQTQYALPYWMVYNPVEISLVITIINAAVDPTNLDQPLLNTIVFTTLNPLFQTDFLFSSGPCTTNAAQATSIYTQFQTTGLIDENNLVSPSLSFNDYQQITLTDTVNFPNTTPAQQAYNNCLSQVLKYALLQSIQQTPIYLSISPSLTLTLDGSTQNYIQTRAEEVNIVIEIKKLSGKFIFVNQISVSIQINTDQNILSVTGLVENVNSFLSSEIIIFPVPPNKYQNMYAQVTVSDSMNYPIIKNLTASNFPFLALKKNIIINPKDTLQSQVSSDIPILTEFSFIISSTSFIVPDFVTTITYTVLISKGGVFQPFDNTDWLQYDALANKFYGTPPQNAFETSVEVQVTGSDGFTTVSDTFSVTVNQLPVMFVIQWIGTIVGPITGVFGVYKSRSLIYNIFYKKKNRYSTLVCKPNEPFFLKIPLLIHEMRASQQIMNSLIKILAHKKITYDRITANQVEDYEGNVKQPEKNEGITSRSNFKKLTTKMLQGIDKIQEMIANDINAVASVFRKKLRITQTTERKTKLEQFYMKTNGAINMEAFIKDIVDSDIKFKLNSLDTNSANSKEELYNQTSTMNSCLRFQLARRLIVCDLKTFTFYTFMKMKAQLLMPQLTDNDWYKYYVNLESSEELDNQGRIVVFPALSLHFNKLMDALKLVGIIDTDEMKDLISDNVNDIIKQKIFDIVSKKDINLNIIEQVLYADVIGIYEEPRSSLFPCQGESIYLDPHEIKSIVALRYSPGRFLMGLQRMLGIDYKPYGPQGNMQLPSWLSLDMQPGLILMKGTPELQNAEDILIRFYTVQGYIIRHFILKVEEDYMELQKVRDSNSKKELSKRGSKTNAKKKQQQIDYDTELEDLSKDTQIQGSPLIDQRFLRPSIFSQQVTLQQQESSSPQISHQLVQKKEDSEQEKEKNRDQDLMDEIQNLVL